MHCIGNYSQMVWEINYSYCHFNLSLIFEIVKGRQRKRRRPLSQVILLFLATPIVKSSVYNGGQFFSLFVLISVTNNIASYFLFEVFGFFLIMLLLFILSNVYEFDKVLGIKTKSVRFIKIKISSWRNL